MADKLADFRGKRVLVVGLGREGLDLALFLARAGAQVTVSDRKNAQELAPQLARLEGLPIHLSLGGHDPALFCGAESIYVSPGVPLEQPALQKARDAGVPLTNATDLFLELCIAPVVGITGSSGKTTTSSLVGEMLKVAGRKVVVGGNIGVPLLNRLPELQADWFVVMELSSFQLQLVDRSPHGSAILNITPNHLDRHRDMEEYACAKLRILRFQGLGDWAVLNAEDQLLRSLGPPGEVYWFSLGAPVPRGAYLKGDVITLVKNGAAPMALLRAAEIPLRGLHNVANVLAACAMGCALGLEAEAMAEAIRGFRAVSHRLQLVGFLDGVSYYNDSIGTSPERSIAALRAFEDPVVLIAGGRDKHLPMGDWVATMAGKVRHLLLLGEAADLIEQAAARTPASSFKIHRVRDMADAVGTAHRLAQTGDVVLLSPGCASYDMFADFEERGEAFTRAVRSLVSGVRGQGLGDG